MNFFWMNSSKITASVRRVRMRICSFRESSTVPRRFHARLEPLPHVEVVDVHELRADVAAVGLLQLLDDRPQRPLGIARQRGGEKRPVHVGLGKAVVLGLQLRRELEPVAQRIHARGDVAADAVVADELIDLVLQNGRVARLLSGRGGGNEPPRCSLGSGRPADPRAFAPMARRCGRPLARGRGRGRGRGAVAGAAWPFASRGARGWKMERRRPFIARRAKRAIAPLPPAHSPLSNVRRHASSTDEGSSRKRAYCCSA